MSFIKELNLLLESIVDDLIFNHELTDAYKGQHNIKLTARYQEQVIAHVDYSIVDWDDDIRINYIEVDSKYRNQGIGKVLIEEIMKHNNVAYDHIDWGYMTDDGYKLKSKLDISQPKSTRILVADVLNDLKDKRTILLKQMEQLADNYKPEDKDTMEKLNNEFIKIDDEIFKLDSSNNKYMDQIK